MAMPIMTIMTKTIMTMTIIIITNNDNDDK